MLQMMQHVRLYFSGGFFHREISIYNLILIQVLYPLGLTLELSEALEAGTDGHVVQAVETPYAAHANGKVIGR